MPALNPRTEDLSPATTREEVAKAASGDVGAFERLYRAQVARVHSLARRMAGPAQADELTQDVFVRAWQKLGTFRGDSAFSTWLHRLAVNVIIERFRVQGAERLRLVEGEDLFAMTAGTPVRHAERLGLEAALELLPPGAKRVFVLHDVEGYKHHEIAGLLEISVGTSKAQLHRARMLMRRHLT
jgi:RNA polymerase sigma-70 factor (ECF subfamily)